MRARLAVLFAYANATYWFLPALMTLGGVLLALLTTYLDRTIKGDVLLTVGHLFAGGPEDARQLFNTVAGAMITVAGVTFSLAILVLTLASQQFGPRLLYNFMRDTGTQVVLGTFVSTFTYCLLVLRTVHVSDETTFVPQISAITTIALALFSQGILIYFIHHVASAIRVNNVVVTVSTELCETIEWYCTANSASAVGAARERDLEGECSKICESEPPAEVLSAEHGYLEVIDYDTLLAVAEEQQLLVRVNVRTGVFVIDGDCLAEVWPVAVMTDDLARRLREAFVFGAERTSIQDVEFSLNQLVEIGVRALSAAINDPNTAVLCIDQLSLALARLAKHRLPSAFRTDAEGCPRLLLPEITLAGYIRTAFDPLRQYGAGSVAVMRHLLKTIKGLARHMEDGEAREELPRQAEMIRTGYGAAVVCEEDRNELSRHFTSAMQALEPGE